MKPKIAFIGTGGTLSSLGAHSLDFVDYSLSGKRLNADEIVANVPELQLYADIVPVSFRGLASFDIAWPEWCELVGLCETLVEEHADLSGIVIGHGTSTMEETAYVLNLTLTIDVPVVLVGAQRPFDSLSSDGPINLVNAVRVALCAEARNMGVLVVLNDAIHAAREVTKGSTLRLHAFQSPDSGPLGCVDGDRVSFYRRPLRRHYPRTEFDMAASDSMPRVDIVYAYPGSDGTAIQAFLQAGAKGIVSAGFAPGHPGSLEDRILQEASDAGVIVVQASRAQEGRVPEGRRLLEGKALSADNLNPEKARLLLALALSQGYDAQEIRRIFATY
ncbi:asparaginase [Microvirga sp. BT689]|uniref:asparaginase n=1 Tax=Microvirga arvi TaxID=2778731 RepID=UPI001950EFA1|nr:asparaginase [Microvirga arvi]MBM6581184.1 asparaginase [Microvirga arvi]